MPALIKVCGVTRPEDAQLAVELGADLLGLNFHPPSPRCLDVERAAQIADSVRGRLLLVGVFVDRPAEEVEEIGARVGLDLFQFHGDESREEIARFGSRAIRVLRLTSEPSIEALDPFPQAWGFLAESRHGSHGGAGRSWPYEWLRGLPTDRPVLVAGGVGPDNAGEALTRSGATGVDVCSGVESASGIKDEALLRRLFDEVRDAQENVR